MGKSTKVEDGAKQIDANVSGASASGTSASGLGASAKAAPRSGLLGKAWSFSGATSEHKSAPPNFGSTDAPTGAARGTSSEASLQSPFRTFSSGPTFVSQPKVSADSNRSVIARGCRIAGEVELSGETLIEGEIQGTLRSSGTVVVGAEGVVEASVEVTELVVFGTLSGEVSCSERIELHRGAVVTGKITSPRVVMHDGVRFDGECRMPAQKAAVASGQQASSEAKKTVNE